jgi:hypothetical protein
MKKYTKKLFLDYASAFDYYDKMKETMQAWSLKDFHEFYGFTHKDWRSGEEIKYRGNNAINNKTDK